MKLRLLILILSVICLMSCKDNRGTYWISDVAQSGLKGNVKSIKHTEYKVLGYDGFFDKGCMEGKEVIKYLAIYNRHGSFLEWNQYDSEGSLQEVWKTEYNDVGNRTLLGRYYNGGTPIYLMEQEYNSEGKVIEKRKYNSEKELLFKWVCEYDDKGNMINHRTLSLNDSTYYEWYGKYDINNRLIEGLHTDAGVLQKEKKIAATLQTNELKDDTCINYDYLNQRVVYEYHNNGRIKKRTKYKSSQDCNEREISIYDDRENKISVYLYDLEDKITNVIDIEYDQFDNKVLQLEYGFENKQIYNRTDYIYTYDYRDNWIRLEKYRYNIIDGVVDIREEYPYSISERDIKYY